MFQVKCFQFHSITMLLQYYTCTAFVTLCAWKFSSLYTFIGIVPSSVVLTGFQVMSRVFLTWAVTHSVREVSFMFIIKKKKCIYLSFLDV